MVLIRKLEVFSFAKFQAILLGLIGLVCGIIYSFGGFVADTLVSLRLVSTPETPGLSLGTLLAFGALIGMPLIFALTGYFLGVVEALLYNYATRFLGSFSLKFSTEKKNSASEKKL